jgi:hypothetical protein
VTAPKLTRRDRVQIAAALRYWGRAAECSITHPKDHPLCKDRFDKDSLPMVLDEIENLIGRIDGSLKPRERRVWNPLRWL